MLLLIFIKQPALALHKRESEVKRLWGAAILFGLSGCVAMQPKQVEHKIPSTFDAEFARNQVAEGQGEINGTAFLRQRGGGVVTCAGQNVYLVPVTDYASDRFLYLYGSVPPINGVVSQHIRNMQSRTVQFVPDPPEYKEHIRTTKCDAQGEFHFAQLKDGEYYINASVFWEVQSYQGGTMATRAKVQNGKSPRIIMSN